MNLQLYMCVVTEDGNNDILTANNYSELIKKTIDNLLDNKGEDYPDLAQFIKPNSVDFITECEDEEYRDVLNEMVCYLASQGCHYTAKLLEIEQEISEEEHLVSTSHEVL